MTLPPGAALGPYVILSPLGAGGMGEVYRARDNRLGRHVAVKVLPEELSSDPDRLNRFEQEARAASALNHPNIVTIYDVGQADSRSYIAMELVEGKTLKEVMAAGPLPLRKALHVAAQVADGLAKAHAAGIVHRDLKPENLMISNDGFVKILDFGLAKLAAPPAVDLSTAPTSAGMATAAGVVLGTAAYMSPEQASGKPVDFRSDQFSVGSVLYEIAAGRRPFQGETPTETIVSILRDEPEPIGSHNPRIPAPFCWIVERCLAKDPEDRYASTHDLARDLASVRERLWEAPSEAREPSATSLPPQRTGFVGRERELAATGELLLRPEVRLLTLTGPGGIGKTRLAVRLARESADRFPAGLFFVPLASAADADSIPSAICQTLRVREGAAPPLEALQEHLQSSLRAPMLLLLDGFEHLLSGAPVVMDLLATGPNLKILVTSRSPLHVYGEHEFPVPPLALPDPRKLPSPEALSRFEAVALFLARARAVKPDFAVTDENAEAIADICARLDGLPLAIELAAARVKLLSPALLRTRLSRRLDLLTGGARDLPARQQTLRGAIDWSHDLLDEAEQRLFRRIAVFVGGCTLEAVEAVCDARGDLGIGAFDGMASMVDKSLMQQTETKGNEPRFIMLETIREYALERLAASGDEAVTRRAHAAYGVVMAEEEASKADAETDSAWLDRFEAEEDNFRAALDYLTHAGEAEWGLRLAAALFRFWDARDRLTEGRQRLESLLKLPAAATRSRARSRALFAAGVLAGEQGDYGASDRLLEEGLEINRELGDNWGAAVCLNALAVNALDRDIAAARALFEENVARWRELGDRRAVARSLSNLAGVVKSQGDCSLARELEEESLGIFRDLGDRSGVAWALDHLGDIAREQGDAAEAGRLYEQSLALFRELNDRWGIGSTLADLGNLQRDSGNHAQARFLYRESLRHFHSLDHRRGIARLLECFASSAAAEGEAESALRLAGAAASLRRAVGAPLARADQARLEKNLEPARRALTDSDGAARWMEGWAMAPEKAIELVLGTDSG